MFYSSNTKEEEKCNSLQYVSQYQPFKLYFIKNSQKVTGTFKELRSKNHVVLYFEIFKLCKTLSNEMLSFWFT